MPPKIWRIVLIAPARTLAGMPTQVVSGVVQVAGQRQIAVRVGDYEPAVMGDEAVRQHIDNCQTALNDRRS
jgi:hypothetical protein